MASFQIKKDNSFNHLLFTCNMSGKYSSTFNDIFFDINNVCYCPSALSPLQLNSTNYCRVSQ